MNHRCPTRVVRLINKIRSAVDAQVQKARSDANSGKVRLFVCSSAVGNKFEVEEKARRKMAVAANDSLWDEAGKVKTLILEHHMAAKRMGFLELFDPLYKVDDFKTGLRDGSLTLLRLFSEQVLPLVRAERAKNSFAAAAVLRKYSPLMSKKALEAAGPKQLHQLKKTRLAVDALMAQFSAGAAPSFLNILRCIWKNELFEIPDALYPFSALTSATEIVDAKEGDSQERSNERLGAIEKFLAAPFSQIDPYAAYVTGAAPFDTHQGVKGLEFPRVMVVMDDEDAGGFLFSYEKLFGAKEKSKTDIENERTGNETAIGRTRRLFYVTCSRTQSSLAIVAYSSSPEAIRKTATEEGWFDADEIESVS
jgi:DNA helicase-2/ATP-dependent DNA helicase PcrA